LRWGRSEEGGDCREGGVGREPQHVHQLHLHGESQDQGEHNQSIDPSINQSIITLNLGSDVCNFF